MIQITTRDRRRYGGESAAEIVARMRDDGVLTAADTLQDYMRGVALRALQFDGIAIRTDSPEHFLEDLARFAIVKIGGPTK